MPQPPGDFCSVIPLRAQAVLLRYYKQELAPRFDLCDLEQHFSQVVPLRARFSSTLLSAIYTISARHLVRLQKYRNSNGVIEWNGDCLPEVSHHTALHFHNECIRVLLRLSIEPEQIRNEDLLAASILLRTDEEMDAPLSEDSEDKELFLRVTNVFINAQVSTIQLLPLTSPMLSRPPEQADFSRPARSTHSTSPVLHPDMKRQSFSSSLYLSSSINLASEGSVPPVIRTDGLRQACFWVAFRQELHASLMTQRPFNFPLSHCDSFRKVTPAEDAVWANRAVVFCADVVAYCYGSVESTTIYQGNRTRWTELKDQEQRLSSLLPGSFRPIYAHEPESFENGRAFPDIWFQDQYHVVGTTHLELARILLSHFDPRRSTLGLGHLAAQRELASVARDITRKLCGMALGNRVVPPTFLSACAAIVMCGDKFTRFVEQEALIWFLRVTEEEVAYPTERFASDLRRAWAQP